MKKPVARRDSVDMGFMCGSRDAVGSLYLEISPLPEELPDVL